nr:unnamed protein product [Callosobruchus analis]
MSEKPKDDQRSLSSTTHACVFQFVLKTHDTSISVTQAKSHFDLCPVKIAGKVTQFLASPHKNDTEHLRFDDVDTREDRRKIANQSPIRGIFHLSVERCKSAYTPFLNVTIDEKLKAGEKALFAYTNAKSFYTCNLEVYVSTQPTGPYAVSNSASSEVERLVEPLRNSKKSIICENWFTGIPLTQRLLSSTANVVEMSRKTLYIVVKKANPIEKDGVNMARLYFVILAKHLAL